MWLRFALLASLLTPVLHAVVLLISGQDAMATPVRTLSRPPWGALHTVGLVLFSAAHVALAVGLGSLNDGGLWRWGRWLLIASSAVLIYIAYFFSAADPGAPAGTSANDPLWIVATLTGFAMGALQPGLSRLSHHLGMFSAICLGVWLWLVPLALFVDNSWIGGYERIVGIVYVTWMTGLTFGLLRLDGGSGRERGSPSP